MTRAEISLAIKTAVAELNPVTRYGRGRITEFNSIRAEEYPAVWQETTTEAYRTAELTAGQMPLDDSPILLHIAQFDKQDSLPDQYEAILDQADLIARKLVYLLNTSLRGSLSSISATAFVKKNADCLTGVLLTLTLTDSDTTVNCE